MQPDNKGLRLLFLMIDITLLFIAIYAINYFNPIIKSDLRLFLLHAAIAEVIAYILYSKRSYYYLDNYKSRVKHISLRMFTFIFVLFVLAEIFLPNNYSPIFLLQYVGVFYLLKLTLSYTLYKYLSYKRSNGKLLRNIVILGLRETDLLFGYLIEKNQIGRAHV